MASSPWARIRIGACAKSGLVLATLFLATFAVGCGEMLVAGVLDLLARDLDVSVPAAGSLMTASALGLAIGGPVLTALTIRIDRRSVLIGALAAFVVFTALPVVVTDYHLFLVDRFASGALQGLLIAAAFFIGQRSSRPSVRGARRQSCCPASPCRRPRAYRSAR